MHSSSTFILDRYIRLCKYSSPVVSFDLRATLQVRKAGSMTLRTLKGSAILARELITCNEHVLDGFPVVVTELQSWFFFKKLSHVSPHPIVVPPLPYSRSEDDLARSFESLCGLDGPSYSFLAGPLAGLLFSGFSLSLGLSFSEPWRF